LTTITPLDDPYLGYALDPGETGIAYGAPASRSISRVLNQEISNYSRFQNEAAQRGGRIVYSKISLDLRKRGPYLAAVAGKTEVKIAYPDKGKIRDNGGKCDKIFGTYKKDANGSDKTKSKSSIENEIRGLENKLKKITNPVEREEIEERIKMLKMALNAVSVGIKIPEFFMGRLLDILA
jgi:hypothetical protein